MLFTTIEYWLFFSVVFVLYHILEHRWQNLMLLAASYIFYAAWDVHYAGLMALSTAMAYFAGLAAERKDDESRRRVVIVAIIFNLGILGVFKYWNFFIDVATDMGAVGQTLHDDIMLSFLLPVGISFYTFQSISYVVDVYRGDVKATKSPFELALYISLFPQLVAGPIERASQLMPQVIARRPVDLDAMRSSFWLIAWGLYKKVAVADTLAHPVNSVFATADVTGPEVYVGMLCFALQIYCDFSGYTDIARGCARLIGFELMLNFNITLYRTKSIGFLASLEYQSVYLAQGLYLHSSRRKPSW